MTRKIFTMTIVHDTTPDRSALVYRHHEQLYRLALLVAGDARAAAAIVERAYYELLAEPIDAEADLIRALLPRRGARDRWRWSSAAVDLTRATLDQARAAALLKILAAMSPRARLSVGLHYISGVGLDDIAALLPADTGAPSPPEVLARFQADAARAIRLVPIEAADDLLLSMISMLDGRLADQDVAALRRAMLEQTQLRELRDGLIAVRALLPHAIPAFFAAVPPPALTARLLERTRERRRPQAEHERKRVKTLVGFAIAMLTIAAAIVLVPTLTTSRAAPPVALTLTTDELIDAAIHRFDRAPVQSGVLHERYRVERDGQPAYLIERWYDYGAPHRLAVTLKLARDGAPPLMQIASDGRSLVQYRYSSGVAPRRYSMDARVSTAEAQAVLPLLRSQPTTESFSREGDDKADLSPFYLAQARAAGATFLGQSSALGRPAFLLAYHSERPPAAGNRAAQVVLTIDAQTYALLDVAILTDGETEGAAQRPLRAELLEVLPAAPDSQFRLESGTGVVQRSGMASVRAPYIDENQFITIEDATRRAPRSLLAPQQLPDARMRGLAVAVSSPENDSEVALLYEGEFQSVLLLPGRMYGDGVRVTGEEQSAGDFRYRIVGGRNFEDSDLAAVVYRSDAPDQRLMMVLSDEYATRTEREATLQQLIASLTPITEQNLPIIRRNFYGLDALDGKG
jgi:hypothetical protein